MMEDFSVWFSIWLGIPQVTVTKEAWEFSA
jgi:hypothetical protein